MKKKIWTGGYQPKSSKSPTNPPTGGSSVKKPKEESWCKVCDWSLVHMVDSKNRPILVCGHLNCSAYGKKARK